MSISSSSILDKVNKNITLFLFFILPSKITNIFINLSILAVIYDIRNTTFSKDNIDCKKLSYLLKVTVNEDILLLPNYTIHWFWDDKFLNSKTIIDNQEYTIKEVIKDTYLFFSHIRKIIDLFIDNLPNTLKIKMKLNVPNNRIIIKHNLMNILLFN